MHLGHSCPQMERPIRQHALDAIFTNGGSNTMVPPSADEFEPAQPSGGFPRYQVVSTLWLAAAADRVRPLRNED